MVGPFSPYRGGIAHFSKQLFHGLKKRGHDVEVVTFTRQYPKLLFPGKTQLEEEDQTPGTRLLDTANPFTWSKTGRYVARSLPDTVVFQHWRPFFCPSFASVASRARRAGASIVCVVHNVDGHEKRLGDRYLTRHLLGKADRVVVMSEAAGVEIRSLGIKADIRRVRHGIYDHFGQGVGRAEARERLDLPGDAKLMLFFGFVRKYKGLRVLLESMPVLLRVIPKLRLVIAGEFYDDPAPYRALINRLGISDSIIVRDSYVPSFKVAAYFSAADVVVQPYLSATQSGVAQIAFNYDTPVIVTDVGGLAEVVPHEKAGLVVRPDDPHALTEAVVRYFTEGMAERLTDGVRREKHKYGWDRLCDAVESVGEPDDE